MKWLQIPMGTLRCLSHSRLDQTKRPRGLPKLRIFPPKLRIFTLTLRYLSRRYLSQRYLSQRYLSHHYISHPRLDQTRLLPPTSLPLPSFAKRILNTQVQMIRHRTNISWQELQTRPQDQSNIRSFTQKPRWKRLLKV